MGNVNYIQNQIDNLSEEIIVFEDEIKILEKEKNHMYFERE